MFQAFYWSRTEAFCFFSTILLPTSEKPYHPNKDGVHIEVVLKAGNLWIHLEKKRNFLLSVIWAELQGYPAANFKYYGYDSNSKCAPDNLHRLPQERVQQSWWLTAQQQAFSCNVTWSITRPRWTSPGTTGRNFNQWLLVLLTMLPTTAGGRRHWYQPTTAERNIAP